MAESRGRAAGRDIRQGPAIYVGLCHRIKTNAICRRQSAWISARIGFRQGRRVTRYAWNLIVRDANICQLDRANVADSVVIAQDITHSRECRACVKAFIKFHTRRDGPKASILQGTPIGEIPIVVVGISVKNLVRQLAGL